jgi:hypothetical protein
MTNICDICIDKLSIKGNKTCIVLGYSGLDVCLINRRGRRFMMRLKSKSDYMFEPLYETDMYKIVKDVYKCEVMHKSDEEPRLEDMLNNELERLKQEGKECYVFTKNIFEDVEDRNLLIQRTIFFCKNGGVRNV